MKTMIKIVETDLTIDYLRSKNQGTNNKINKLLDQGVTITIFLFYN